MYRGVPCSRASSTRSQPPTSMWPAALTRYVTGKSKISSLVRRRAAGAASPAAAASAAGLLARGADLADVPFGEFRQDFELPGAALAPILVDGHLNARF